MHLTKYAQDYKLQVEQTLNKLVSMSISSRIMYSILKTAIHLRVFCNISKKSMIN